MTTATVAAKPAMQPKPLPAPNSDFYEVHETLSAEELATVKKVRAFMEAKVAPVITQFWVDDAFPFELLPGVKELGIGGLGMQGYGCAGGSVALLGFVLMEIARVDPSFATFLGVHDGLAMGSIYIDGSEEQEQKWVPPMARFEKIGCFGLTEPLVGSGASGGLTTTAKRDGENWILDGEKRWIGILCHDVAPRAGGLVGKRFDSGCSVRSQLHVTFGAVRGPQEVIEDPQLQLNDIVVPLEGAGGRLDRTITSPIQVHGITKVPARRGPALGEHNAEVLEQLGFGTSEIDALYASGAVPTPKAAARAAVG
jgi:hypothetical protein